MAGGVEGLFGRRWRRPFSPAVEEAFLGLPQCPHRTADFSIEDKFTTAVCVLNFFNFFPFPQAAIGGWLHLHLKPSTFWEHQGQQRAGMALLGKRKQSFIFFKNQSTPIVYYF